MKYKILVITPVRHIEALPEALEAIGEITYLDDPSSDEVVSMIGKYDAIFTNPNKSKVFIGKEILDTAKKLKVICTASTGTNHIDKSYAAKLNLPILALTEEREVINRISSTAELAFSLTLSSLRHVVRSHKAVLEGEWNYEKYIGRQMNCLTIGTIGYGRLGKMYSSFSKAFNSRVVVYDPYKIVDDQGIEQVDNLESLLQASDVIAIHVHVTEETINMINKSCFDLMKNDVVIVNTSRGDMVNEKDLVNFLKTNPSARIATDVLADEVRNRMESPLLKYAQESDQVIITPHIGGMCREAQEIAYGHAVKRLTRFIKESI
ncbi:hydroxyacid dehydrogenase [Candidatus Pseudothioglobus singularis]|jgi:phosphoglycerate dehydrogenase-like enzyme|nr:hydroxyacid dehydrogenase [Candidatus Pseudothioglobus singularis]